MTKRMPEIAAEGKQPGNQTVETDIGERWAGDKTVIDSEVGKLMGLNNFAKKPDGRLTVRWPSANSC